MYDRTGAIFNPDPKPIREIADPQKTEIGDFDDPVYFAWVQLTKEMNVHALMIQGKLGYCTTTVFFIKARPKSGQVERVIPDR